MPDCSFPQFPLAGRRILVTGGSGFIGSHLVERLLREQADVAVLSRTRGKLDGRVEETRYRFLCCDLRDRNLTEAAITAFQPEIVFHLASHPDSRESVEQASASLHSNALSTLYVLESLRLCRGALLVYGDSCKVYGDGEVPYREAMPMNPVSSYAIGKAAGWHLCNSYRRVHGVPSISIRPTMIHGPRQSFNLISYVVGCVLDGKEAVVLDGGSQTRDLLAVEDAVEAYVRAAAKGPGLSGIVINIGGGAEKSVAELARLVLDILDSRIPVISSPGRARPTEMQRSFCDNAEAERYLGWRPALDVRAALEKTVAALTQPAVEPTRPTRPLASPAPAA